MKWVNDISIDSNEHNDFKEPLFPNQDDDKEKYLPRIKSARTTIGFKSAKLNKGEKMYYKGLNMLNNKGIEIYKQILEREREEK